MKVKWWLLVLVFVVGLFLWLPSRVAAKSYEISKTDIAIVLGNDGSMTVSEASTFNFDGDFSFAYEYFNKQGSPDQVTGRNDPYEVTGVSVCDETGCYRKLTESERYTADDQRPPQTFYFVDEGNRYQIRWFYRSSSSKQFQLTYEVANAVTRQTDTAELYWQLVGSDWGVSHKNIEATIMLPQGVTGNDVQAYAHGPWSGRVSIPTERTVIYSLDKLPSDQFFEARILLPKDAFSEGAMGTLTKAEIVKQEEGFIRETERKKGRLRTLAIFGAFVSIIISGLALFLIAREIRLFWLYGKDNPLPEVNLSGRLWEPPSDIDPAQIEQLLHLSKTLSTKAFTATILSLVQQRVLRIARSDKKEGLVFKKYKYYLVPLDSEPKTAVENFVHNFLIHQVGVEPTVLGGKTTTAIGFETIISWFRQNKISGHSFLQSFQDVVLSENFEDGHLDKESHRYSQRFVTLGLSIGALVTQFILVSLLAGAGGGLATAVGLGIVISFIALFLSIIFRALGERRTDKGREETAKWLAFQKHLNEYSLTKNYPIDSVILWEKYLVYGTVLGISTKALADLPVKFNQADSAVVA